MHLLSKDWNFANPKDRHDGMRFVVDSTLLMSVGIPAGLRRFVTSPKSLISLNE
jgi:hypothetical protein